MFIVTFSTSKSAGFIGTFDTADIAEQSYRKMIRGKRLRGFRDAKICQVVRDIP